MRRGRGFGNCLPTPYEVLQTKAMSVEDCGKPGCCLVCWMVFIMLWHGRRTRLIGYVNVSCRIFYVDGGTGVAEQPLSLNDGALLYEF
ncbi:MAG: hypothetical protein ACLU4N_19515 [Butyricimonas faecihominis]